MVRQPVSKYLPGAKCGCSNGHDLARCSKIIGRVAARPIICLRVPVKEDGCSSLSIYPRRVGQRSKKQRIQKELIGAIPGAAKVGVIAKQDDPSIAIVAHYNGGSVAYFSE